MTIKSQILFFLFLILVKSSISQTFDFENFTTKDGIAQDFIYSVNQDANGYLWVGTGNGLSRYNGKTFKTYSKEDGLKEDIITSSYIQKNGTNWFGHIGGGLTKMIQNEFIPIQSHPKLESQILFITGLEDEIYFISQNEGLYKIVDDKIQFIGSFDIENITSLLILNKNNILIGSSNGINHLKQINNKWELVNNFLTEKEITALSKTKNFEQGIIGTISGEIYTISLEKSKLKITKKLGIEKLLDVHIKSIFVDNQNNLWIASASSGLINLTKNPDKSTNTTVYSQKNGLVSNFLQTVFKDIEGNIWIGGFGSGLSKFTDDFFTFYKNNTINIYSVISEKNHIWYGTDNGFEYKSTSNTDTIQKFNSKNGFIDDKVISLILRNKILWIGTENNGVYSYNTITKIFSKLNFKYGSLHNHINQLIIKDESLWIATNGGLIIYNLTTKLNTLLTTEDGLAHNSIKSIYLTDNKTIYLGVRSQYLYAIENGQINEIKLKENSEVEIIDITEDFEGNIIVATAENGIFIISKDQNILELTKSDGLKSNYTYAVEVDINNNIWIGHRDGLSKYNRKESTFYIFGNESGIEGQINFGATFLDSQHRIWFGTDSGLINYDPQKDKSTNLPPKINLTRIIINDIPYPINEKINLPYGNYRVEFEYIGISLKNPDEIKYKTLLFGHDDVYSNLSKENKTTFGKLTYGEYEFRVKAYTLHSSNFEKFSSLKITIAPPYWRTWWFFTLCALLLIASFFIIDRIRSRRLRVAKEKLEIKLKFKTKEVVEKAKKIGEINNDLTASINYAKRIQSAILPVHEYLNQFYPKSFIFFRPRDIVSGDFYFIEKVNNKLIVACVDCTGHGVPGAFMSMIGSVTLRNIYKTMYVTNEWLTPEKVLDKLDKEIEIILKQKSDNNSNDFERSRDGMDLTLLEIDLATNTTLFSSAKRQTILKRNNIIEVIPGAKRSIGGGDDILIDFVLYSTKMYENDAIYLFTDGFPDQFGGERRKKLKVSGVKKMTEELLDLPQKSHFSHIDTTFTNWQGQNFQIDDVLFMGIEF